MQTLLSGSVGFYPLENAEAEVMATHARYLNAALRTSESNLFLDYVAWAGMVRATAPHGSSETARQSLEHELNALRCAIGDSEQGAAALIDQALQHLDSEPTRATPPLPEVAGRYLAALLDGNVAAARAIVFTELDQGRGLREIYLDVFQRSQHEVGRLWQINRISVAQEHFCTAATQQIMTELYPRVFASRDNSRGPRLSMVAANASGDQHQIGIRMIADLLEVQGWDTHLVQAGAAPAEVIAALVARQASLLAISVTMTYHLQHAMDLIAAVREHAPRVKILVGGYPFNVAANLWRSIGADGMARDAAEAVGQANILVRNPRAS